MQRIFAPIIAVVLVSGCGGGASDDPVSTPAPNADRIEHLSAGDATVSGSNANAFSQHSANMLDIDRIKTFNLGNDFFENPWVSGSASTSSRDGLGALFNNNACQDCHIRDGRGQAPEPDTDGNIIQFASLLFKAARSSISDEDKLRMSQSTLVNVGDSSVGGQLQHNAISGVTREVSLNVNYEYSQVSFNDGMEVELRKPTWHITSNYAEHGYDFDQDTIFSPRLAPPMIGLGLIALISDMDILANQDIDDADSDGISGKANFVWSQEQQAVTLGRFGWKAGQPSLVEQTAGAFVNDMGLTSRIQREESCLPHQADCQLAENGNGDSIADYDYEVSDTILEAVSFYSSHLGVPQRRNAYDAEVQRGKIIFQAANCNSCHVESSYVTEWDSEQPELSRQTIFPYTDLLLHDMGEQLADVTQDNLSADRETFVEYLAGAHEWRTPPLWGLGMAKVINPQASFLHDGRARTIMEAILWHGGEAQTAKEAVLALSQLERQDLLAFLNDL